MKVRLSRGTTGFLTTLLACGAFLVGAVKLWGISSDKMFSALIMIVLMVAVLAGLALLLVVLIKLVRRDRD